MASLSYVKSEQKFMKNEFIQFIIIYHKSVNLQEKKLKINFYIRYKKYINTFAIRTCEFSSLFILYFQSALNSELHKTFYFK